MAKKQYLTVNGKYCEVKERYLTISDFVKRNLPSGYTQALYIESTGTQYINTGYNLQSDNMRIVTKFTHTKDEVNVCLFASESASATYSITTWLTATAVNYAAGSTGVAIAGDYYTAGKKSVLDISAASGVITKTLNGNTKSGNYGAMLDRTLPLFIFAMNQKGSAIAAGSFRLYSFAMYDNGTLVRDYIPCRVDATGEGGLYDMVSQQFFGNAGSGAFIIGEGTGNEYHKIKKGYLTIGGVLRPFIGSGKPAYWGTTAAGFPENISGLGATSVGDYAIFGGGESGGTDRTGTAVAAYDKSLTQVIPEKLTDSRRYISPVTVGNHALFAGGQYLATVDAYDTSLTRTSPTSMVEAKTRFAGASLGNYAFFAGGAISGGKTSGVEIYDSSLTRTIKDLPAARDYIKGATVGDYALFAGGRASSASSTTYAINKSLTISTPSALTSARMNHAGTSVGNYALFGGGNTSTSMSSTSGITSSVNAYNKSLTRSSPTSLSVARVSLAATTLGDYALFEGGTNNGSAGVASAEVYDTSLTRTTVSASVDGSYNHAGTTIGDYALFGAGNYISGRTGVVRVYKLV